MKRVTLVAAANLLLIAACLLVGPGCSNDSATGPDEMGLLSSSQSVVGDIDFTDGYPWGVWQDDFEPYEVGFFPPTWIADGNVSNSYVDGSISYDGSQSLRLYGTPYGTWAGCAYKVLDVSPPFEIKVAVYNGSEDIGGKYPARGLIGLLAGTNWIDPERTLLYFHNSGDIMVANSEVLGTYNSEQWYHIRIRYERPSETEVKLRYWINNQCVGSQLVEASQDEDDFTHLELLSLEGSAWFDNVEICSRP
jgi:hypothetical protein